MVMDPEAHDRSLALTSHMPHLVASALVSILTPELAALTATGFRDTTRIAAGDPALLAGGLLQKPEALVAGLGLFGVGLDPIWRALENLGWPSAEQLFGP